jgi:hypothetical protein
LLEYLNANAATWTKTALELALRDAGAPAGIVKSMDEVFEGDGAQWTVENPSGATRARTVAYSVTYFG